VDDTQRHTLGGGLPGSSPTAPIYDSIYNAQGGNAPTGSPTDWLYNDMVNAQGGHFPQGPDTPQPAAAAAGLPAGGGGGGGGAAPPDAMAAGPGWYVDSHGRFVSDNMGEPARANQIFDRNVSLGPNTVIDLPGKALSDYGTGQGFNAASLGPQGIQLDPALMAGTHMEQNQGGFMQQHPGFMPPPGTIDGTQGAVQGLPAGGAGAGLPGSTGAAGTPGSFQQEFQQKFGFYNPDYNSQANMERNLISGDANIKAQAQYMAQFDPTLAAEGAFIASHPDFYNSQLVADHTLAHNQELAGKVANNQLTLAQAQGQAVNQPAHPIDNAHALMTQQMQDTLVQNLTAMGVDPNSIHQTFQPGGGVLLEYTAANGTPQRIKSDFMGYAQAIDQLKQNVAAAAPGGGAGPRTAPPRGGGGFAPPQAPPAAPGSPNNTVTPPSGITGAAFGTNSTGQTVGGPYTNRMGPLYDEFGNPYGAGYQAA
jgi:hypothetical protein